MQPPHVHGIACSHNISDYCQLSMPDEDYARHGYACNAGQSPEHIIVTYCHGKYLMTKVPTLW